MNIHSPLYWVEVAERTKRLNTQGITNIKRFRKPLIIFQVLFALFMIIIGVVMGYFSVISIAVIPIILGIALLYFYSLSTLKSLFASSSKDGSMENPTNDPKWLKIIDEFRATTKIIIAGLLISFVFMLLYGVLGMVANWKEICREGSVNGLVIAVTLSRTGFVVSSSGLVLYIHRRIIAISRREKVAAAQERTTNPSASELSSRDLRIVASNARIRGESHL